MVEIADRRNELSGNLSLYQELHFIEKIDTLLDEWALAPGKYRPVTIRIIEMSRSRTSLAMGAASKINRDPAFLQELIAHGAERAADFITALDFERAWLSGDADAIIGCFADDAEISSTAPFRVREPQRGRDSVRGLVTQALSRTVRADLTRRQQAGALVRWRVTAPAGDDGARVYGTAAAAFDQGKITDFRLGPLA